MAGTVLQVVESFGGWRLLDDGQPIFWFPERDSAIETARVMADARHQFDGRYCRHGLGKLLARRRADGSSAVMG